MHRPSELALIPDEFSPFFFFLLSTRLRNSGASAATFLLFPLSFSEADGIQDVAGSLPSFAKKLGSPAAASGGFLPFFSLVILGDGEERIVDFFSSHDLPAALTNS